MVSPHTRKPEPSKFRVVCQGDAEKITLRAKAKDKYEAFEQATAFLRSKEFDYCGVLIESC